MLFHTWPFALFFAVVYAIFLALRGTRWWQLWLLIASYVFYGWWNPAYLALIGFSGDRIVVKNVVNENSIDEDFTELERTHAKFRKIGRQISDFLGTNLIGMDVITPDISKSPDQENCMITEVNIPPGLHYHVMLANSEAAVPIGPKIVEFLLSDAGIPMSSPLIHRQLLSLK